MLLLLLFFFFYSFLVFKSWLGARRLYGYICARLASRCLFSFWLDGVEICNDDDDDDLKPAGVRHPVCVLLCFEAGKAEVFLIIKGGKRGMNEGCGESGYTMLIYINLFL